MSVLWLVCDVSGSMLEAGKRLVVRGLVRQAEQYLRLGYATGHEISLVAWNNEVRPLDWFPGEEIPAELFDCGNSADGEALARFLADRPGDRFLILTDGFWTGQPRAAVARWRQALTPEALRIVTVGTDANPRLTDPEAADGTRVFESEDFLAALDGWLGR
jgi:hypothetical protein